MPSKHVQDIWLEELGIATIAGTSFGDAGADYIRLSFANSTENINEALDKIEAWVKSALMRSAAHALGPLGQLHLKAVAGAGRVKVGLRQSAAVKETRPGRPHWFLPPRQTRSPWQS